MATCLDPIISDVLYVYQDLPTMQKFCLYLKGTNSTIVGKILVPIEPYCNDVTGKAWKKKHEKAICWVVDRPKIGRMFQVWVGFPGSSTWLTAQLANLFIFGGQQ